MSSVTSSLASPSHGARFFVSVASAPIYTAAGASAGSNIGANTVVRDMGKTIRTPGAVAVGSVTTAVLLRKVAIANANPTVLPAGGVATSFVGFNDGPENPADAQNVFYINVYDGKWVSVGL